MTGILVGCPLFRRGWILPDYFDGVEAACFEADVTPSYVFVADPRDADSQRVINKFQAATHRLVFQTWVEERLTEDRRVWNGERYHRMVYLRNLLLDKVRELEPEFFLSLDSDIILHPEAIVGLIEATETYDVVGGKVYMTPYGCDFPSCGFFDQQGSFYRYDIEHLLPVDVVMACKLMTPFAYRVDYEWHEKGEDLGICLAWKRAGLKIGFDGRVCSKHVMSPDLLDDVDIRCGF